MDPSVISAMFEISPDGELIVKEKALQKAVEANSLAGRSPGGLPGRAVLWGD